MWPRAFGCFGEVLGGLVWVVVIMSVVSSSARSGVLDFLDRFIVIQGALIPRNIILEI